MTPAAYAVTVLFLISEQFAFVHLKNVKTPTLILQGDADLVDPPGQRQELYRGLKRYGIETEFVVYPCEPHGSNEEKHPGSSEPHPRLVQRAF